MDARNVRKGSLADEDQWPPERPLIAITGHSLVRRVSPGVLGPDLTVISDVEHGSTGAVRVLKLKVLECRMDDD